VLALAGALVPRPGHALELDLLSLGARVRFDEKKVLGEQHPESFKAYDVEAIFRMPPFEKYSQAGWGIGLRLLTGAGILQGRDDTALVVSATPIIVLGSRDGRFNADVGAGLALFSQHRFAQQDFGGNLQATLTFGVSIPLYRQLGLGYRFMHYSDAGVYGQDTIGADFHMVVLNYRF